MANPQTENGFTAICNEIMEHLIKLHLPPNQWQVLLCIIRKTYGYRKKVDYIANCQICESTELRKDVVSRSIALLEMRSIIIRQGKVVGLQKDWEQWKELAKLPTDKKLAKLPTELAELSTKVGSPLVTQKKKENIQKKRVESLEEYTDRVLKPRFPKLDFDVERQKFDLYWSEGNRKLQRPKTAFTNWCERAEQFRLRDSKDQPKPKSERSIKEQFEELANG